jgi:hypothetical protein
MVHVYANPFTERVERISETISLTSLFAVAAIMTAESVPFSPGTEAIVSILVLVPMFSFAGIVLGKRLQRTFCPQSKPNRRASMAGLPARASVAMGPGERGGAGAGLGSTRNRVDLSHDQPRPAEPEPLQVEQVEIGSLPSRAASVVEIPAEEQGEASPDSVFTAVRPSVADGASEAGASPAAAAASLPLPAVPAADPLAAAAPIAQ